VNREEHDEEAEREDERRAGDRGQRPQGVRDVVEPLEQELDDAEMDTAANRRDKERSE